MISRNAHRSRTRRGKIVVLAAALMVPLLGMVAFAVDVGYVCVVKNELQNAADAAALAGCARYLSSEMQTGAYTYGTNYYKGSNPVRTEAQRYVQLNQAGGEDLVCNLNTGNSDSGDIVLGYINPVNPSAAMVTSGPQFNSVQVRAHRNATHSGSLPLFFGPVLGRSLQDVSATGTATLTSDSWSKVLPITMHLNTFNALLDGTLDGDETDNFSYNADIVPISPTNYSNRVAGSSQQPAADGIRELKIYPDKHLLQPGNFGTVDLGHLSGSTSDVRRQIAGGLSLDDRYQLSLQGLLDPTGRLLAKLSLPILVSGDSGISWTIENDLKDIIGQMRTMPVHNLQVGQGSTAIYTVIGFINVVVVESGNLQSGNKTIRIQPIAPFRLLESPDGNGLGSRIALTR